MKRRTTLYSMHKQPDTYPLPIVTLADLTDAMANILYVYDDDRCGWEDWCYTLLHQAGKKDVEVADCGAHELRVEHMIVTRKTAHRILRSEEERVLKGKIKRDAFVDWIVEHVVIAYQNYCNHKFKALLTDKDSYAAKNTYW